MSISEQTRTERDSMGEMQVPANAYYGASTQRAVLNFPISNCVLCAIVHSVRMPRTNSALATRRLTFRVRSSVTSSGQGNTWQKIFQ